MPDNIPEMCQITYQKCSRKHTRTKPENAPEMYHLTYQKCTRKQTRAVPSNRRDTRSVPAKGKIPERYQHDAKDKEREERKRYQPQTQ